MLDRITDNIYERDLEFIAMVASGLRYEEIARLKNVSVTTVRMSLYKVRDSMGAKSVAQVAILTHQKGLLIYEGQGKFRPNLLPDTGNE